MNLHEERLILILLQRIFVKNIEKTQNFNNISFDIFIETLIKSGLTSVFLTWLHEKEYSEYLPKNYLKKLMIYEYALDANNKHIINETRNIYNLLMNQKVNCVVLKGISKLHFINDSLLKRPISDVDLFINSSHIKRAIITLLSNKFEIEKFYLNGIVLYNSYANISVDLHWNVYDIQLRNAKYINLQKKEIFGDMYTILSNEEILIFECVHYAFHHKFHSLHLLIEIGLFIKNYSNEINWDTISDLCTQRRIQKICYVVFIILKDKFKIPVPDKTIKYLKTCNQSLSWNFVKKLERIVFFKNSNLSAFESITLQINMLPNVIEYLKFIVWRYIICNFERLALRFWVVKYKIARKEYAFFKRYF